MIQSKLGKLEIDYLQEDALSVDGETTEDQTITFRAVDGVLGRFYQIVYPHNNGAFDFSEPEDLQKLAEDFKNMASMIQ